MMREWVCVKYFDFLYKEKFNDFDNFSLFYVSEIPESPKKRSNISPDSFPTNEWHNNDIVKFEFG